jgi:short-subunit dehydrogenase
MDSFHDRVVLITGAASGIGRALALALAGEGARIAALDRQAGGLETLAVQLAGKPVACATADVTDLAALRAAVRDMEAKLGPVDLLIASAGIGRETSAFNFNAVDLTEQVQVNLIGVINSIDAVLEGMCQRQSGHLVVLSSLASYRGLPRMGGYCASKAGVNALFDSLRSELRGSGVALTTVCPGWVRTPLTTPLDLPDAMLLDVEEATRRILAGVQARKPFVAFPAASAWQVWLLRHLPRRLSDWLAHRLMHKAMLRKRR